MPEYLDTVAASRSVACQYRCGRILCCKRKQAGTVVAALLRQSRGRPLAANGCPGVSNVRNNHDGVATPPPRDAPISWPVLASLSLRSSWQCQYWSSKSLRVSGVAHCEAEQQPASPTACESGTPMPVASQRIVYRYRSIIMICVIAVHIHIERIALACTMTAASCLAG